MNRRSVRCRRGLVLASALVAVLMVVVAPGAAGARGSAAARPGAGVLPVAHWQRMFDAQAGYFAASLRLAGSSDSYDHYNGAYAIDAYASMVQATGQRRYATRALALADAMVASARPSTTLGGRYRDSYRGWVSQRSDVRGQQVPLFETYAWRYVTHALVVVRRAPSVWRSAAIRADYRRLLAFAEREVFQKWFTRGADANIYRSRTHMASHWAYLAVDLGVLTTSPARRARYAAVFANINRHLPNVRSSLRRQLTLSATDPSAYVWSDEWNGGSGRPQDVDHANGVISYVVEARGLGREWSAADLARFTATFNRLVWPQSGVYRAYVDGTGSGSGWFSDGFVKLGRYDRGLQVRLQTHRVGRSPQFLAAMALNALRLAG